MIVADIDGNIYGVDDDDYGGDNYKGYFAETSDGHWIVVEHHFDGEEDEFGYKEFYWKIKAKFKVRDDAVKYAKDYFGITEIAEE